MAKYFEADFRKGSFADQTGRRTVTVNGSPEIKKGKKGLAVNTTSQKYLTYSSQILPDNAFTIVTYAKRGNTGRYTGDVILSSSSIRIGLSLEGAAHPDMLLTLNDNATNNRRFIGINDLFYHCLIITIDGNTQSAVAKKYLDGILELPIDILEAEAQGSRSGVVNV